MQVVIKLVVSVRGYEVLSNGSFPVNERLFKENPDKVAARVASEWITEMKREVEVEDIIKVVYNDDKNITELVKEFH
jgi:hypothetical protein